ncbi:hypothetical protein BKA63DRAFT_421097 [Paraphoma chrysanthemicola]|nr:hypothetical protein BKA63DRAFT_421097 [Paraphoma chrysanthemicola]
MSQDRLVSIRTTQRAPRSCIPCSSRKVKCDKSMPCATCIRRGKPESCIREMVIVRGEVTAYRDERQLPTYEELRCENERLRQEMEIMKAQQTGPWSHGHALGIDDHSTGVSYRHTQWKKHFDEDQDGLERQLWHNLASDHPAEKSSVTCWSDITLPTPLCSKQLIDYDEKWNSWVHYALEYPQFRDECDSFMAARTSGTALEQMDPFWLAVYFSVLSAALLMMDHGAAEELTGLEPSGHHLRSKTWYDAAVFCLHEAEFIRVPNVRSVQAIAILGICFNNFGDSELGNNMWTSALQIAKRIGLDTPVSEAAGKCLSKEAQHRLWWTLVICEWLIVPYRSPAVDDFDFDVPYPTAQRTSPLAGSDRSVEHPVHYHVFMARASKAYYRFRRTVRMRVDSLDSMIQAVRDADEELAGIIETLPTHLQPDAYGANQQDELRHMRSSDSWVTWQRFDVTVVLLHLRIRINRTLQDQWLSATDHNHTDWARTVSVRSAISVIWINSHWNQPASMRKQWALSYHIFVSALLLIRDWQDSRCGNDQDHREAINMALEMLDRVKLRNAIAQHASLILRGRIESIGLT